MKTEARQRLLEVAEACRAVARFAAGRDFAGYLADEMLRSAVERKLEIIGEAFRRLEDAAPDVAGRFPELRQVVGLRNRIIHGYDSVDDELVWDVATSCRTCGGGWKTSCAEPPASLQP